MSLGGEYVCMQSLWLGWCLKLNFTPPIPSCVCVWGGGCSAVWNMTLSDDRMFVNITVDSKQELELELGGPKVLGVVF